MSDLVLADTRAVSASDHPPIFPAERVAYFAIDFGHRPREVPAARVRGGIDGSTHVWVDVVGLSAEAVVEAIEPLALPSLRRLDIQYAVLGLPSDTPWLRTELGDDYDEQRMTDLAEGRGGVRIIQGFEPVFVQLGAGPDAGWSIVMLSVSVVVGPGWLLTIRRQPIDLRWGTHHWLPVHSRDRLADLLTAPRNDFLTADLALLLFQWFFGRAVRVAHEVGVEIGRRALDFHRSVADYPDRLGDPERVQRALYDLRWTLDALETHLRGLTPSISPPMRSLMEQAGRGAEVAAETKRRLDESLEICDQSRRRMAEVLSWLASAQTQSLLESQADLTKRSSTLQTLVGLVTALFLGPTLVATVFGASPEWWDQHQEVRGALLGITMVLSAFSAAVVVHRVTRRDTARPVTRGQFGNPVHYWPHRLFGCEINRQVKAKIAEP